MFKSIFLNVTCANIMLFSSFVLRPAPPLCPLQIKNKTKIKNKKNIKLFGFIVCWLWKQKMKIIPETQ